MSKSILFGQKHTRNKLIPDPGWLISVSLVKMYMYQVVFWYKIKCKILFHINVMEEKWD